MKKHNKQGIGNSDKFVCDMCKLGVCENCIDVLRSVYTDDLICRCQKKDHLGEAINEQVVDPFTETVHGPAASISREGEVEVSEEFKQWWAKQFGSTRDF